MKWLSNIPANAFTISAFTIGLLLIDDLTPAEQNSVGNWFMMIGQVLATNASQQQVINNAKKTSNEKNAHIVSGDENSKEAQMRMMEKVMHAFDEQMNHLKRE